MSPVSTAQDLEGEVEGDSATRRRQQGEGGLGRGRRGGEVKGLRGEVVVATEVEVPRRGVELEVEGRGGRGEDCEGARISGVKYGDGGITGDTRGKRERRRH